MAFAVLLGIARRTWPPETEAKVMRCRPDPQDPNVFDVGARFLSLSDEDRKKLTQVVNRYLKEQWGEG